MKTAIFKSKENGIITVVNESLCPEPFNQPKEVIFVNKDYITNTLLQYMHYNFDMSNILDLFLKNEFPTPDILIQFSYLDILIDDLFQFKPCIMKCDDEYNNNLILGYLKSTTIDKPLDIKYKFEIPIYYDVSKNKFTLHKIKFPDRLFTLYDLHDEIKNEIVIVMIKDILKVSIDMLLCWLSIQTILLDPVIKPRIKEQRCDISNIIKSNNKRKKQPKKYVKRITIGDISDILAEAKEKRGYNIKEDKWYVVGHYRNYKSGKRTWVNGYWKGKHKNDAMNIEPRERKLVLN